MTALPFEPRKKIEENFEHQWLYSVVPARAGLLVDPNFQSEIGIYLAGYCRVCRRAFSSPIPFGSNYIETQLDVPKTGCVGPLAGY